MTAVLAFIHARKWLVELILLAAIVGGVWWFCQHLIQVGVQRERAAWMKKVDEANLENARLQGKADAAEAFGKREQDELKKYIADHPMHGSLASLCKPPSLQGTAQANGADASASPAAKDFLSLPEGDHSGDEGEPDQLGMLSVLAGRADAVSAQLREWQSR